MDAREVFIPAGHPNRPGTKLEALRAIVIHYTANSNPSATAEMNAKYFGRKWVKDAKNNPMEADGKTAFAYGSAQVVADENEVVFALPPDETAWACGDSRIKLPNGTMGQQPLAKKVFQNRQNHFITSIEICNNGNWDAAVANAKQWTIDYLREKGVKVDLAKSLDPQNDQNPELGSVLIVRHFDITGKACPKPFIDDGEAWKNFVTDVATSVNT